MRFFRLPCNDGCRSAELDKTRTEKCQIYRSLHDIAKRRCLVKDGPSGDRNFQPLEFLVEGSGVHTEEFCGSFLIPIGFL